MSEQEIGRVRKWAYFAVDMVKLWRWLSTTTPEKRAEFRRALEESKREEKP